MPPDSNDKEALNAHMALNNKKFSKCFLILATVDISTFSLI